MAAKQHTRNPACSAKSVVRYADIPRRRRSGLSDVSPANGAVLGVAIDTYTHLMPVDEVSADVLEGLLA